MRKANSKHQQKMDSILKSQGLILDKIEESETSRIFAFYSPKKQSEKVFLGNIGEIQLAIYYSERSPFSINLVPVLINKELDISLYGSSIEHGIHLHILGEDEDKIYQHIESKFLNLKKYISSFKGVLEDMNKISIDKNRFLEFVRESFTNRYNERDITLKEIDFNKTDVTQFLNFDPNLSKLFGEKTPKTLLHAFSLYTYWICDSRGHSIEVFETNGNQKLFLGNSVGSRALNARTRFPRQFYKNYSDELISLKRFNATKYEKMLFGA